MNIFEFHAKRNNKGKWVYKGNKPKPILPWLMKTVEGLIGDQIAHLGKDISKKVKIDLTTNEDGCILRVEISNHE